MVRALLLCIAVLALAAPASAMVKLPELPRPVSGNPADRLPSVRIEASTYDPAHRRTSRTSFWRRQA